MPSFIEKFGFRMNNFETLRHAYNFKASKENKKFHK